MDIQDELREAQKGNVRLTEEEFGKVHDDWLNQSEGAGETSGDHLYRLIREAEDAKRRLGVSKPDRRAELLELAGKLAIAWTQNPGYEITPTNHLDTENYGAAFVGRAKAILDAVDTATRQD